jgi:putative protease
MSDSRPIGKVKHFFTKIGVAIVDVDDALSVGDRIQILGPTTNFDQPVESMQIEHQAVKKVKAGDSIGLKVSDRCREGDTVFKIT